MKPKLALCPLLALFLLLPNARAEQGNPSPPPASGTFSVGPTDASDTIVTPSGSTHTYRVHNDGPGTIHVQPKKPNNADRGPGIDVDPGDAVDVELDAGDHLDVENNTGDGPGDPPSDAPATGTFDRIS